MNARERHIAEIKKVEQEMNFIKDHKKPHYRDLKRKYVRLKQELFLYDKLRSENNGWIILVQQ